MSQAHVYHGNLGMPEGTLFYDGCPECEKRAEGGVRGLLTQDIDRVHAMWDRMVSEERGDGEDGFRSECERKIGRDLYAFGVLLERDGHRDPWRILSANPGGSAA
jgi:hypothetical protein